MIRYAAAALVAVGLAVAGQAGEFNKKLNIGDAAPAFSQLEGVDGKMHALADYKDKDVLVVVITCNHCPIAVAYEDRIIDFAKKHTASPDSKIGLVAINVNNLEQDKLDKMKERAKEKGFNFPYLYDPSQKIAKELGATKTPEFFVLNKDRKVVYMGAMDDSNNPKSAKVNFLEDAVKSALSGSKPEKAETAARGCSVKFD
jgi:peroxiredoxin